MSHTEQQILAMKAGPVINGLIATEIMGWERVKRCSDRYTDMWKKPNGNFICVEGNLPSQDIAQAYEAEEMVPKDGRFDYGDLVSDITNPDGNASFWTEIHATPLQRCKALLIWKMRSAV